MKWWKIAALVIGTGILGGLVIAGCAPNAPPSGVPASRPTLPSRESTSSPQVVTPTPIPTPTPPPPWYIAPPPTGMPYIKGPTPYPPPKNAQELLAQQEEIDRKSRATGGTVTRAGPETKGATITVAGKNIKLPDDAYWDGIAMEVSCLNEVPCAQTPIIGIVRGKSEIGVSINTGQIAGEKVAPGEEGAFAFLDKELPPQVIGPRTRGATLRIAGRDLKLPEDAWVGAIIEDKDMVPGRNCVPPPKTQY